MADPYEVLVANPVATPQTEPVPGREAEMVVNAAGGYGFALDCWARLHRFLVLGTASGTYYQEARDLTKENVEAIKECLKQDGIRLLAETQTVNLAGRAPKVDPQLFVMSMAMVPAYANEITRQTAAVMLPPMLRTFTHVAVFCKYLQAQRGWGEVPRRAVRGFFEGKSAVALAYQGAKYPQREGWTQRDVLRTVHPIAPTPEHADVYDWLAHGLKAPRLFALGVASDTGQLRGEEQPEWGEHIKVIWRYEFAQLSAAEGKRMDGAGLGLVALIKSAGLPWEAVPMAWRAEKAVWEAALPTMPPTATLRNLGQLTSKEVLAGDLDANTKMVVARLGDADAMKAARVHPMGVYQALCVYKHGKGIKGSNTWSPLRSVLDALDGAFYASFGNLEPTGKNIMIAIDTSGSMGTNYYGGNIPSFPGSTTRDLAGAFAMVVARSEKSYQVVGFDHRLRLLDISPKQRLDDVIRNIPADGGSTDAALPMLYAMDKGLDVDAFVVITDGETWAGKAHPFQALQRYRKKTGKRAKLVVVAMTASRSTIGDTQDAGTLEVVGWDSAAPGVILDFIREG